MKQKMKQLLYAAAASGCLTAGGLLYYGHKKEPETLTVTRPRLSNPPPVRIVFFSDVHLGGMYAPEHLSAIVDKINSLRPDLVLFGGDFFAKFPDDYVFLDASARAGELARIKAPMGKYAVLGNHDIRKGGRPYAEKLLRAGGFTVLWDSCVSLPCRVEICGLSPYSSGRALKQLPNRGYRICLCHMPDRARYLPLRRCDLMLSGHSHGGQVRLPVLTRVILPPGGKMFPLGLYFPQGKKAGALFVSRGIGMSGLPFRFLCPPELVLLKAAPKQDKR